MKNSFYKVTMFLKVLIFILIITLSCAKITINIEVGKNKNETNIEFNGHDNKLVTDKEIRWFNISMVNLNRGAKVELGRYPDEIFLKDPTTYGYLYTQYKWHPINRNLHVINAKVLDLLNEDIVLGVHEHINNTTENIKSKSAMFKNMESTARSRWSVKGLPYDNIKYDVEIKFDHGLFKYNNQWRNETLNSVMLPVGIQKDGNIEIKPGQTVITKLTATKINLYVQIDYKAHLIGNMVANFARRYGRHHFWAPSIEDIMKAAVMKNEILTSEFIDITGYLNPKLTVYDKKTGKTIRNSGEKKVCFRKKNNKSIYFLCNRW